MRRAALAIGVWSIGSACAAAAGGAAEPRSSPPPATAFATLPTTPTDETEAEAENEADVADEASVPGTADPTSTVTVASTLAPPTTTQPADGVAETAETAETAEIDEVDEVDADEPSFDIGPQVEIDVDLARFPVDDAGQGGTGTDVGSNPDEAPAAEAPTGWAGVDRYLESVLIRPGNTAAGLAVSIDGDIVHTAAFGVRDPATGDPAGPDDRFRIASISKPITAIVALALVEAGTLDLDEPVGSTIADHVGLESPSAAAQRVTLRQLLTHRSGYGKYESTFFRGGADDCDDAARRGLSSGGGGGGYTYSNMNYCLVGLLIEAATGLGYEQAVYQYLLTPLGISGMRLPPTIDPGPGEIQHQTTPGRNYMETLGAAGAWIASPSELVTILDALDLSTSGFKPLGQDTVFEMVIPPGGAYGDRGYGLGVISYGAGRFGHTGTIEATHAMLLNRGDGVTWAITVAGQYPGESTDLERIMNRALEAGGFVTG